MKARAVFAIAGAAIVVLVATAGWLMTRKPVDEDWAIQALRTINGAQVGYFDRCDGYAPSLLELRGAGDLSSLDVSAEGTIADGGYLVILTASTTAAVVSNGVPDCDEAVTDYFARADPLRPGRAGTRHFATDSGGTIFHDTVTIQNPIPSTARAIR